MLTNFFRALVNDLKEKIICKYQIENVLFEVSLCGIHNS